MMLRSDGPTSPVMWMLSVQADVAYAIAREMQIDEFRDMLTAIGLECERLAKVEHAIDQAVFDLWGWWLDECDRPPASAKLRLVQCRQAAPPLRG